MYVMYEMYVMYVVYVMYVCMYLCMYACIYVCMCVCVTQAPSPFSFPVFQAGKRICLGERMAIFEAKIAISILMQNFNFTITPGVAERVTYAPTLTMSIVTKHSKGGDGGDGDGDGGKSSSELMLGVSLRQ